MHGEAFRNALLERKAVCYAELLDACRALKAENAELSAQNALLEACCSEGHTRRSRSAGAGPRGRPRNPPLAVEHGMPQPFPAAHFIWSARGQAAVASARVARTGGKEPLRP